MKRRRDKRADPPPPELLDFKRWYIARGIPVAEELAATDYTGAVAAIAARWNAYPVWVEERARWARRHGWPESRWGDDAVCPRPSQMPPQSAAGRRPQRGRGVLPHAGLWSRPDHSDGPVICREHDLRADEH